ncbi:hypothetical protein KAFR_0A01240 [Kazachstania africana CBS 2517]|uniref:Anaphase-promoting complex subunit 11 n=1 Tax=Kazachstania africana (strain ATCC 22294 / BCRC 22015 / CBS 2517 / CECT 1963 / NBRC 1671 / NRRL Y-8276) TaxID=1071382 RepID=H2AMG3_KAZAF|nr:hypothetical protein KAFR_0A01240 [Kazachstania africana CBS 2517]CCF55563.1 hypothetical protein KAFR_0A01240 [Kazachstania africana CBS 2517]
MKVTVKKIYPVYAWSWDIVTRKGEQKSDVYSVLDKYRSEKDDVCGICRASYNGTCPSCKIPGTMCPLIVGSCNHNFHYHCIFRWLNTLNSKGLCPMCRQEFKLDKKLVINSDYLQKFEVLARKNRERRALNVDEEDNGIDNMIIDAAGIEDDSSSDNSNFLGDSHERSDVLMY